MIPAAPLVGAVTTLPPAAFSSFTAIAHRLIQSIIAIGSDRFASWRLRISAAICGARRLTRSEEHTSELQSLMRSSYAVFCLKKKITRTHVNYKTRNSTLFTPDIMHKQDNTI